MQNSRSTPLDRRVTFRPVSLPEDDAFLSELYFSTRQDIAELFPEEHLRAQMLTMQYNGQKLTYREQFPDAQHNIVLLDGDPVGRTMIELRDRLTYFIDFSILPGAQNLGIGRWILERTFRESQGRGVPVAFHVEKSNSNALRLYERLGAKVVADEGTHFYVVWETCERGGEMDA